MMIHKARIVCAAVLCAGIFGAFGSVSAQTADKPQNISSLMQQAIERKNNPPADENVSPVAVKALKPAGEVVTEKETVYLTPGKSKVINLDKDAASVIVADTNFINVFLDSPRTAVIVPRKSGATEFSILDATGGIIYNKTVMVSTETDKRYVRIHRICGTARECKEQTIYYCEDNCVDVTPTAGNSSLSRPIY